MLLLNLYHTISIHAAAALRWLHYEPITDQYLCRPCYPLILYHILLLGVLPFIYTGRSSYRFDRLHPSLSYAILFSSPSGSPRLPSSGGSRGGGRNRRAAPLKLDQLFFSPFYIYIRMLKNKAQIARESIKTALELPGPLGGPWTPAESEFGFALVCVRAHNHLLRPP